MLRSSQAARCLTAVAGILLASAQIDSCDPDYECKFTVTDYFGTPYEFDFSRACNPLDYTAVNANNITFNFNICGITANHKCLPAGSQNQLVYGAAMQVIDPNEVAPNCSLPSGQCFNPATNATECCTQACEVLGAGEPIWSLLDPYDPAEGGVQVTYFGVESTTFDKWACPKQDNGAPGVRTVTIVINCDPSVDLVPFVTDNVTEPETCKYVISGRSAQACGCAPYCVGATCGDDGCGGSCSGGAYSSDTGCPFGYECMDTTYAGQTVSQCCKPDCTNRDCGSDGCGGSCGTCGDDEECTSYSVCVPLADEPVPNPESLPITSEIEYYTDSPSLVTLYLVGAALVAFPLYLTTPGGKRMVHNVRTQGVSGLFSARGDTGAQLMAAAEKESKGATVGLSASKFGGYGSTGGAYGSTTAAAVAATSTEL